MLSITQEQFDVFRNSMRERFVKRLAEELKHRHPGRFARADDEELHSFADTCLKRAEGYQLRSRSAVTRFAHLMAEYGADFDLTIAHARRILRRFDLTGGQKLDRLERALTFTHR